MLAHKDWDNIVHYFPVQRCSWDMGQHCTGNFLVQCWHMQIKTTLYRFFSCENVYALDLHCASNYPVQCCLRRVWTTLNGQYFYAMLSQHGRYNTALVFFLMKVSVCHGPTLHRWFPCAILTQKDPDTTVDYFPPQSCSWTVQW